MRMNSNMKTHNWRSIYSTSSNSYKKKLNPFNFFNKKINRTMLIFNYVRIKLSREKLERLSCFDRFSIWREIMGFILSRLIRWKISWISRRKKIRLCCGRLVGEEMGCRLKQKVWEREWKMVRREANREG